MEQQPLIEGQENSEDVSIQWVNLNDDIKYIEQGIPLTLFDKLVANRNQDMEFRLIRRITETQHHNEKLTDFKPNLSSMNRFQNIIPYKHSSVDLKMVFNQSEVEREQYINASWVNSCLGQDKAFIATQGPKSETFDNFWKMIWENDIENIIMLCNLKENDKSQCEQYWPNVEDNEKNYGKFKIKCIQEEKILEHIAKRTIQIQYYEENKKIQDNNGDVQVEESSENSNQNQQMQEEQLKTKITYQYQFLVWPDHQIPSQENFPLTQKIVEIATESFYNKKKSIVHCSAGIGRTGTLISLIVVQITLDNLKEKFKAAYLKSKQEEEEEINVDGIYTQQSQNMLENGEQNGRLSIFGIVRRLREQRWGMVHNIDQYGYIYKYASEILKSYRDEVDQQ